MAIAITNGCFRLLPFFCKLLLNYLKNKRSKNFLSILCLFPLVFKPP
ncbi:hypothetical protein Cabys_3211 [Caldithrix abyssi DSM 13497]|uniref:Uncharacterized protein n=1 Tax=Caldithrix abyssi DSM 13497 TaxID=880073 RepID=A0A1J1CBA2_CALAY|nr:hypothetical protein Cabys_3211 [Caldithrix abyssi DSM 13497]